MKTTTAGVMAGVAGGVVIWAYEAVVWVKVQGLLPLAGIAPNAVGLVFGKATQASLGSVAYLLGAAIHFSFAAAWGVLFANLWPSLRRRGVEASLAAIVYAALAWVVMHASIALISTDHPNYLDPVTIIGGFVSHLFYTVPMALLVKRWTRTAVEP